MQLRANPLDGFQFRICAGLRLSPCAACFAVAGLSPAHSSQHPGGELRTGRIDQSTPIDQPTGANAQMELRERDAAPEKFAAANAERRKQIAEDSVKLLKLAADLKAEFR
jgi:hypothetical protein